MSYPRHQLSRQFKKITKTGGSYTVNSTSWANLDTATDLILDAQIGDTIEVGLSCIIGNENNDVYLDVATIVSSAVVNTFSMQGAENASSTGIGAWFSTSNTWAHIGGGDLYAIQLGDLDGNGRVTLRLRKRGSNTTAKTVYATSTIPFRYWVKNLGPSDDD